MVAIGVAILVAEKTAFSAVSNSSSGLERLGGLFGTAVSASFLFLIGLLNLVILAGIVRVFASMRRGTYDEAELDEAGQGGHLGAGGLDAGERFLLAGREAVRSGEQDPGRAAG